jgi:hypothetical protein
MFCRTSSVPISGRPVSGVGAGDTAAAAMRCHSRRPRNSASAIASSGFTTPNRYPPAPIAPDTSVGSGWISSAITSTIAGMAMRDFNVASCIARCVYSSARRR